MLIAAHRALQEGFIIRHYAGDVIYSTSAVVTSKTGNAEATWLDKNNDTLQQARRPSSA